jgi:hypothetical protein
MQLQKLGVTLSNLCETLSRMVIGFELTAWGRSSGAAPFFCAAYPIAGTLRLGWRGGVGLASTREHGDGLAASPPRRQRQA